MKCRQLGTGFEQPYADIIFIILWFGPLSVSKDFFSNWSIAKIKSEIFHKN